MKKEDELITIEFKTKLDYNMDQKVYFYLSNSLEILEGKIIGFFAIVSKAIEGERSYLYQIEYYQKMKDKTNKMFIGNANTEEMDTDKEAIEKRFKSIRISRIDEAIKTMKIELGGAKANRDHHGEIVNEINGEIKRLNGLLG